MGPAQLPESLWDVAVCPENTQCQELPKQQPGSLIFRFWILPNWIALLDFLLFNVTRAQNKLTSANFLQKPQVHHDF